MLNAGSPTGSFAAFLVAVVALLTATATEAADPSHPGFRVPKGFVVREYAGDDLAHNIYSLTIDARGRVVVAGPGYVKTLHDRDQDGRADEATLFSDRPRSGAHGMVFDGPDLICTGDNAVMRLRDRDGDGKADGEPEVWTNLRHAEHGANGLTRGPDGGFYLICGNDAGVSDKHAREAGSPVQRPNMGAVLRFSPNGKRSDVLAHGFRNPYDLAFNAQGSLFTVDADGERDYLLPWYAPTRLFDIAQGQHHGWVLKGWKRSWNRPAYFFDNVPRLVEIGRGSPTGMACYRHRTFPTRYRNGIFSLCWTLGRVYFFPMKTKGSSYEAEMEIFMETTGHVGFAPVDLAVGPSGDLFVAIGGRDTRGGVFRVSYEAPLKPLGYSSKPMIKVLDADQPLSSWSRASWVPLARKLGREPLEKLLVDEKWTARLRMRAIEVLLEVHGGVRREVADAVAQSKDAQVVARLAWALGYDRGDPSSPVLLSKLRRHPSVAVQRAAWEALQLASPDWRRTHEAWGPSVSLHPDRRIRAAAALLRVDVPIELTPKEVHQWEGNAEAADALEMLWAHRARIMSQPSLWEPTVVVLKWAWAWTNNRLKVPQRLEILRYWQLLLGDIEAAPKTNEIDTGYVAKRQDLLHRVERGLLDEAFMDLARTFPTGDPSVDRELARVLGMVGEGLLLDDLPAVWTERSSPADDIHYLLVLAQLRGERPANVTATSAHALASLHGKVDKRQELLSRNWPRHVGEAFSRLARLDPALPEALASDPAFGHAGHKVFAERMPGELKGKALAKLPQDPPPPAIPSPTIQKIDHAAWKKRLAAVDWVAGDAGRGKTVFEQRACAACHAGSRRLGPNLKGIAGRFSRDDLFLHTVDPNLAISPLYKATQITTRSGEVHIGVPVYDSPAATLLETGPGTQVRVLGNQILWREAARLSPMPARLLHEASDIDLADLYAYLKTLR